MPTSCTPETTRLGQEPAHLAWAEEPDIFSIMKLILALLLTAGIPLAAADLDPQSVAGVWQTDQAGGCAWNGELGWRTRRFDIN